nr:hypothetical protein [Tanacetum cinerariifolium]
MDMTIDQQVALDEAFVPHASRLRIGKSNFRLRSNITSKESTLQLVYDVLRLTPFYKALLVTADVPEIYMQEFWATATVHHHSIRFKMNNKKCIINLKYFREMLHICPRFPNKTFDELPFEEEILAFLRYLGHSGEIKKITDAQILWGMYHKKNAYFAYLLWEDFVYQVKHKDAKKSNEMYYPRFTKVIIHFFMTKDPSIPRRNKVNCHYVRDDQMFMTIKLVSRHQNTQQFGAILSIELTNEDVRNFAAYKEYYAVASGVAPPKTKASVRKTRSSSNTTITPPTAASTRLLTLAKGKQPAKSSKAKGLSVLSEVAMTEAEHIKLATKRSLQQTHISQASGSSIDEGTGILPWVLDVPTDESDEEISWKSSDEDDDDEVDDISDDQDDNDDQDTDNDGDDFVHPKLSIHEEEAKDKEIFDLIVQTLKNYDDEGNDDASLGMIVSDEEGQDAENDDEELYRDVNINLEGRDSSSVSSQFVTSMLNPCLDAGIDSLFESTPRVDVQASTTVAPLTLTSPTLLPPTNPTISQFDGAVSFIPGIVERYMDQRMNEAIKVAVQIQSDRLQDEAQAENEEFLNKLDENIQNIIKEKVKEQVKVQVSKILPKIEKNVNEQLEAEVLTRSSISSKTSYAIILDTYGDSVTFKRHRDDADKDEEPFAGSDRGSKRRREGKEPESTSVPKEKATKTTSKSTEGSKSHQKTASEFAPVEEPMQTTQDLEEPSHQEFETGVANDQPIVKASQHPEWFQKQKKPPTPDHAWNKTLAATHESIQPWTSDIAKQADSHSSFNEQMDTPVYFLTFLMNQLIVDTLTPKLLAGPTYELMKGSCKSLVELEFFLEEVYKATTDQLDWNNPEGQQYPHNLLKPLPLIPNSRGRRVIPFYHFINNNLEYLRGGASSHKYITSVTKTKAADYGHIKWIEDLFYKFAVNRESARDVYSKRRIVTFIELQIVKWHNYKHLDWITLTNLTVEELFAINVSLRMFTRNIVIQRRVEDLQLGVESYQKKLNLTKPDTYRSDLKRKEAYTAYSNPRGFIY